MSLETIKTTIEKLSTEQVNQLLNWLFAYHDERQNRDRYAPEAEALAIKQLQDEGKLEMPDALKVAPRDVEDAPEWQNPVQGGRTHLHQCYHEGDIIQHDGKLWKSTYQYLNSETPGVSPLWQHIQPETMEEPVEQIE